MRIDSNEYSYFLVRKFGEKATVFNSVIENFNSKDKIDGREVFMSFWTDYDDFDNNCDSELCSYTYELYNNLGRFFERGVFGLFKERQVEWGAPEVRISKVDVGPSNIDTLCNKQEIFRGLPIKEHESRKYRQSWTLDSATANTFAKNTFNDEPKGIVVKATVNKENIIYYDQDDTEKEVIVEYGCIDKAVEFNI